MENVIDQMEIISHSGNIMCSICSLDIPTSSMIQHSSVHLSHKGLSADNCLFCNEVISTNNIEDILEHMIYAHEMKSNCPLCKSEYLTMDDLYHHLRKSYKVIHHCCYQDCTFKTDKMRELLKHKKQKRHMKKLTFTESVYGCKYVKVDVLSSDELDFPELPVEIKESKDVINEVELHLELKSVENQLNPRNSNSRLKRKSKIFDPSPEPIKRFKSDLRKSINLDFTLNSNEDIKSIVFTYSETVFEKYVAVSNPTITEDFKTKLSKLSLYPMLIISDEKGKNFICNFCKYESRHSHTDIKRHVFRNHCDISNKNIPLMMKIARYDSSMKLLPDRDLIRFINSDIKMNNLSAHRLISCSDDENVEKISTPQKNFKSKSRISKGDMIKLINESPVTNNTTIYKDLFYFSYSYRVLMKYIAIAKPKPIDNFVEKLEGLSKFPMSVCTRNKVKNYTCENCEYLSVHSHTDIKRHIFRNHCDILNANMSSILKVSRTSSNMQLLSDSELIRIINNEISMKKIDADELLTDSDDESMLDWPAQKTEKSFEKSRLNLISRKIFKYSINILKAICYKENFLEHFERLKSKMDVFSTCGVETYYRNNSKIYMCLNCNWYSKISVDEVLRHALNYHAHLENETKFVKKIVETSYKMNKDYCLLSDDEISKKGWKGRIILD